MSEKENKVTVKHTLGSLTEIINARNNQYVIDRDFAERIVNEVKKRPVLYDASHPDHRVRSQAELEWVAVAEALSAPVETVRKRWQNLRQSYSRSLTTNVGFYLNKQMSFLKTHMAHAATTGNYGSDVESPNIKSQVSELSAPQILNASIALSQGNDTAASVPNNNSNNLPSSTDSSDGQRGEKRHHSESNSALESALIGFLERKQAKSKRLVDPDSDFINGLLPQIKQLNHRNKRKFFRHVSTTLFNILDQQDDEVEADKRDRQK